MRRSSCTALRAIGAAKRVTNDALALATQLQEALTFLRAEIARRKANDR